MRGFHHNNGEAISRLWEDGRERIIQELVFSQTYNLHKLKQAGIVAAGTFSLRELKANRFYNEIKTENLQEILERIIMRHEELSAQKL